MGTARVKQEEETDSRIIARNLKERNVDTKNKSPKQGLTSTKDLKIMLLEGRDYPTIGLN